MTCHLLNILLCDMLGRSVSKRFKVRMVKIEGKVEREASCHIVIVIVDGVFKITDNQAIYFFCCSNQIVSLNINEDVKLKFNLLTPMSIFLLVDLTDLQI